MNISDAQVAGAKAVQDQVQMIARNTYRVPSSDGTSAYLVTLWSAEAASCECEWGRRAQVFEAGMKPCRHLLAVCMAGYGWEG